MQAIDALAAQELSASVLKSSSSLRRLLETAKKHDELRVVAAPVVTHIRAAQHKAQTILAELDPITKTWWNLRSAERKCSGAADALRAKLNSMPKPKKHQELASLAVSLLNALGPIQQSRIAFGKACDQHQLEAIKANQAIGQVFDDAVVEIQADLNRLRNVRPEASLFGVNGMATALAMALAKGLVDPRLSPEAVLKASGLCPSEPEWRTLDNFEWERLVRLHAVRGQECELVSEKGMSIHRYGTCPGPLACKFARFCTSDDFRDSRSALGKFADASVAVDASVSLPLQRRQRRANGGSGGQLGTVRGRSYPAKKAGGVAVQTVVEHNANPDSCIGVKRQAKELDDLFDIKKPSRNAERFGDFYMAYLRDSRIEGVVQLPAEASDAHEAGTRAPTTPPHELVLFPAASDSRFRSFPGQCEMYSGTGAPPPFPKLRGFADHRVNVMDTVHLAFLVEQAPGNLDCVWLKSRALATRERHDTVFWSGWARNHVKQIAEGSTHTHAALWEEGGVAEHNLRFFRC